MGASITKGKTRPEKVGTKEIVVGSYQTNYAKDTGTNQFGANGSAAISVQLHKVKNGLPKGAYLVGFVVPNNTGTSSGASPVIGEGGQTDAVSVLGTCRLGSNEKTIITLYQRDTTPKTAAAVALAANEWCDLVVSGAKPGYGMRIRKKEEVWSQIAWIGATASINFPRTFMADPQIGEGWTYYTDATPSNNTTAATAAVAAFVQPSTSGTAKSAFTTQKIGPGAAGMILNVPETHRHFAIIGTSRQIGATNYYYDPSLRNDGAIQMALDAMGYTYVDLARGAEQYQLGWRDDRAQFRRSLMRGVTDVIFGHTLNMLSNNLSLAEAQALIKQECELARSQGQKFWLLTEPPYKDFGGGGGVVGDPTTASTFASVSATTTAKIAAFNAWLLGDMGGTCSGGDPTILLSDCCDAVIDVASAVATDVDSASTMEWIVPTEITSTYFTTPTVTSGTSSALTVSGAKAALKLFQSYDWFVKGQSSGAWGYIKGNASTTVFQALVSATGSNSWQGGDAFTDTEALKFYLCVSEDGLHPSFYGKQLQAAVVRGAIDATWSAASFDPMDIVKSVDLWIPRTGYVFTESTRSTNASSGQGVYYIVGSRNGKLGIQSTSGNRPVVASTGLTFDSDAYFDFDTALETEPASQNLFCFTARFDWPSDVVAVKILCRFANATGAWFIAYLQPNTGVNRLAIQTRRTPSSSASTVDNGTNAYVAGTDTVISWIVDWKNGTVSMWKDGSEVMAPTDAATAWTDSAGVSDATATNGFNVGHSATSFLGTYKAFHICKTHPGPVDMANLHTAMAALTVVG